MLPRPFQITPRLSPLPFFSPFAYLLKGTERQRVKGRLHIPYKRLVKPALPSSFFITTPHQLFTSIEFD
jgi:hypothetical protein